MEYRASEGQVFTSEKDSPINPKMKLKDSRTQKGFSAFVIPCFNEEITIENVIRDCQKAVPWADIFVFDNNSTDRTSEIAKKAGAIVVSTPIQGKGEVIKHAFSTLDHDVIVIVDGDGTYDISSAPKMIENIIADGVDMVVCNRISVSDSAFPKFHRFGNRIFSSLMGVLLGRPVGDVFSGYRAVSRVFYESVVLESSGFEIESELTLKASTQGFQIKEISAPYIGRPPGSVSKLKTFRDGWRILAFIFSLMRSSRPLLFFGHASMICFGLSITAGLAPVSDFIQYSYVYTVPRAILAASLMVLSIVFLGVGLILDTQIKHLHAQTKLTRAWLNRMERKNNSSENSIERKSAS